MNKTDLIKKIKIDMQKFEVYRCEKCHGYVGSKEPPSGWRCGWINADTLLACKNNKCEKADTYHDDSLGQEEMSLWNEIMELQNFKFS